MSTTESLEPLEGRADNLFDRLEELAPDARKTLTLLDQAREEEDERHRVALAEIEEKRRRVTALMHVLGEELPSQGRGRSRINSRGRRRVNQPSVGKYVLASLVKAIEGFGEDRFTPMQLHQAAGGQWSKPHTYEALAILRNARYIQKEATEGNTDFYRVWDREAAEQFRTAYANDAKREQLNMRVSRERAQEVYDAARRLIEETGKPVSGRQVTEVMSGSPGTTREVIADLRAQGIFQPAGPRRENQTGRASMTYTLAEPEALEALYA